MRVMLIVGLMFGLTVAAPKREPLGLDSLIAPLARVGFKVQKQPAKAPLFKWDSETYGTQGRWTVAFKSTFKSPLAGASYYRFWVDEELFPNAEAAQLRAKSAMVMPPGLGGEARKVFPLRRAFAAGNKVFVVRTDVAAYGGKLESFAGAVATVRGDTSKAVADSLKAEFRK